MNTSFVSCRTRPLILKNWKSKTVVLSYSQTQNSSDLLFWALEMVTGSKLFSSRVRDPGQGSWSGIQVRVEERLSKDPIQSLQDLKVQPGGFSR